MRDATGTQRDASARLRQGVRRGLTLAWVPLVASVRLAQGDAVRSAVAYLQATLVSTGDNDREEVIRDLRLLVTPLAGGEPIEFGWDETGRLDYDADTQRLSYAYVADAGPMLITPSQAQSPLALFQGPPDWSFEPGRYELRLLRIAWSPPGCWRRPSSST